MPFHQPFPPPKCSTGLWLTLLSSPHFSFTVPALTFPPSFHSSRQSTWGTLSTLSTLKGAILQKSLLFQSSLRLGQPLKPQSFLPITGDYRVTKLTSDQSCLSAVYIQVELPTKRGYSAREASNTPEAPRLLSDKARSYVIPRYGYIV